MADFYALGELLIDFTPAGKTPAGIPIFEQNPGGAPANVAGQAARLGVSAGFIGKRIHRGARPARRRLPVRRRDSAQRSGCRPAFCLRG